MLLKYPSGYLPHAIPITAPLLYVLMHIVLEMSKYILHDNLFDLIKITKIMFHFTNINRHKPAPQCAEPLVLCSEMNLIRIRSMYERKYPTTSDVSHNKTLFFTNSDFPKTIRYQVGKNLRLKVKGPQFVTDYLFQKYPDPQSESGSTRTENFLTNT